jgi:putative oxidoreductase
LQLAAKLRRLVLSIAGKLGFLPPLLARVTVGWIFVESGWGKLHNLEKVTSFFRDLGIPAPEIQAPFAAGTELVCGALVLAGLLARVASVPLAIVMVVAIATAKRADLGSLSDLFALSEYLYIVLLVWIGVAGPGPISIDGLLAGWLVRRTGGEPALPKKT